MHITNVMEFDTPFWKIIKYFFGNPYEEIHLRKLSKKTKVSTFSTKQIIDYLVKEKIVLEKREGNMRYIKANMKNLFFRHLKIAFKIKELTDTGLIEYIKINIPAISSIILFGSTARGEDDSKSDIDLLIIGQRKRLDVSSFERKLGRKINLIIMKWSEWREKTREDKAFYREIMTKGIPLYGEFPVIE